MTQFPTKIKVCVSLFWFLVSHRALEDPAENDDVNSVFGISSGANSVFNISSNMQKSDGEVFVQANDILRRWTLSITWSQVTTTQINVTCEKANCRTEIWCHSSMNFIFNLLSPFSSSPIVFCFKQGLAKMPKHPHLNLKSTQFVGGIVLMNISDQFRLSVRTWQLQNIVIVKLWCSIPLSISVFITLLLYRGIMWCGP